MKTCVKCGRNKHKRMNSSGAARSKGSRLLSKLRCSPDFLILENTLFVNDEHQKQGRSRDVLLQKWIFIKKFMFSCSDVRKQSNGILVLGVSFFLQTKYGFLTSFLNGIFLISFKRYCCLELRFEKIFHLWSFFVKLWGFRACLENCVQDIWFPDKIVPKLSKSCPAKYQPR